MAFILRLGMEIKKKWVDRHRRCESLKDPRGFTFGMVREQQFKRGAHIINLPIALSFDIFYLALSVSWTKLMLGIITLYYTVALSFAAVYVWADCSAGLTFGRVRRHFLWATHNRRPSF